MRGHPIRTAVLGWAAASIASLIAAVAYYLAGEYGAMVGTLTGAVGCMGAAVACDRWHHWQTLALARHLGLPDE